MPTQKLSPDIISAAIDGFLVQRERLDAQIAELRAMLSDGRTEPVVTPGPAKTKRRKMSAEGRARIAEAQRKRWAQAKGESPAAAAKAPKAKRRLSAAGRKAIIAATKKRWAQQRAQSSKAGAKKSSAPKKAAAEKTPPATSTTTE
jgi:hypothetical protein